MIAINKPKLTHWISLGLLLCVVHACTSSAQTHEPSIRTQRLEPTGESVAFDATQYSDFVDYINKTRIHLRKYTAFMDPGNSEREIELATPFRVRPDQTNSKSTCSANTQPTRGIVLLHGLSDMPATMRDIANAFAERCFISYSMLLPGHGARPSELLDVSRNDWLAAARFGVSSMQQEVDEVYIGGFSLGGLVAVQAAMDDSSIAGVFAFSPALSLHRSIFLDQTIWLRHITDWLDTDPPDDSWRFESIPYNALAETQLLAKSVRTQLKAAPLNTPIFIAQSPDDAVVDANTNRVVFQQRMTHGASRLLSYTSSEVHPNADGRILIYPSELPEQRILSYAHQAVHIAPNNTHYGVNGKYRNCHINIGNENAAAVDRCRRIEIPFRGEVFGSAVRRYDTKTVDTLARLTFNPQFSELMTEIDRFLDSLTSLRSTSTLETS